MARISDDVAQISDSAHDPARQMSAASHTVTP